ncbi:MAG TPA: GLPGLI family protein [Tenuifilaceae bacterium]|nr:GLPGLI family protein [Tenuifilaceae bacterium]
MRWLNIVLIAVILSAKGFAQEYLIIDTVQYSFMYEYSFQRDSLSKGTPSFQSMMLQVGQQFSRFSPHRDIVADSILCDKTKKVSINDVLAATGNSKISNLCKYNIYKDYPSKGSAVFTSFLNRNDRYIVKQKLAFDWNIASESDTIIMGYQCNMATTFFAGRLYKAWFTQQIPLPEGPYKFGGLPGLIVKISDSKNQHVFLLTGIYKPVNASIIYKSESFIPISAEKYVAALEQSKNYARDLIMGLNIAEEQKAKALYNLNIENNFIEKTNKK